MPWPDFSELSFGFAFLREFERHYTPGGSFPAAPDFITQSQEATAGYDVSVLQDSAPVFFQFKRSFVLTTRRAKEIQAGDFANPIVYRMHLRQKDHFRQHDALQQLEQAGDAVFYVTSQIESSDALTQAYRDNLVLDRTAALFSPDEIVLPDREQPHHASFCANDDTYVLYSEEGQRFDRRLPRWSFVLEEGLIPRRRSGEANRAALERVADVLSRRSPTARAVADRFEDPVIRASVLSFFELDAQLTFFKPQKK